jgi:hypothetical protein
VKDKRWLKDVKSPTSEAKDAALTFQAPDLGGESCCDTRHIPRGCYPMLAAKSS